MRLSKLSFRGVTRFSQTVTIDFDALGPGLVAIVGKNGAGKTSIMEAPAVALFKTFPSRPDFYENFQGRDAFIEVTFASGSAPSVSVRLAVDSVKRTTEGYVLVDGLPISDGKAASFAAAIESNFGSLGLFLAGPFACQTKRGSFLGLVKSDRKDLFVELLGLGAIQVLAEASRARKASAEADMMAARGKLGALQEQAEQLANAPRDLTTAQQITDAAVMHLETTRTEETAATGALERARTQAARVDELQAAERTARQASITAAKQVDDAEDRTTKATKSRDERIRFLDSRGVEKLEPAARARHQTACDRIATDRAQTMARIEALPDRAAAEARNSAATRARSDAELIVGKIRAADQTMREATVALGSARREYERDTQRVVSETARLERQAERLTQVPCTSAAKWWADFELPENPATKAPIPLSATCPLLADARGAKEQLASLIPADNAALEDALRVESVAREARSVLPAIAPDPRSFDSTINAAVSQIAEADAATYLRDHLSELDGHQMTADLELNASLDSAAAAAAEASTERQRITDEYEAEILDADAAITTAKEHRAQATANHAAAVAAARVAETVNLDAALKSLAAAKKDRESAEFQMREADQALARAQAAADRLAGLQPELARAADALAAAEINTGDWGLLERSLGRDGVQALEIDAAGPEVARITNELLTACYGPRFSLTLETLAEKKDGGTKEVFDVRVFDGGRECLLESVSGGEQAILSECLSLSLAIYNCRKGGVSWNTIFRDETTGPLDEENNVAYVKALRRARELAGAFQIVFISHTRSVWEAADVQIHVADGKAYVQGEAKVA